MSEEKQEIIDVISRIFNDTASKIVEFMFEKGREVRDEEIARKLGLRVNHVRRILYSLHENQVVTYRRLYDTSSGWYIYLWKLNLEGIQSMVIRRKKLTLNILKQRLEYERSTTFFKCQNNECPRITFEEALENSFKCPYCGGDLIQFDNSGIIELLEKEIDKLNKEIGI